MYKDDVLVFSVRDQSTLVLSKYSIDNGELGRTVSCISQAYTCDTAILVSQSIQKPLFTI